MKRDIIDTNFVLDKILQFMKDLEGKSQEEKLKVYDLLNQLFDVLKASKDEILEKHNKIVTDGFAIAAPNGGYKITELGKVFIEAGGYTKQTELKYERTKAQALHYGTILGGTWVCIQILQKLYEFVLWLVRC